MRLKMLLGVCFATVVSATFAAAEDLYVAQAAAGLANASSCANAWSLTTVNAAASWGTGAARVSAGDTVRFCGIISGQFTPQGSGAAGARITITAEPGSRFERTHFTTPAIERNGSLSHLRFTGLTINATASGTGANRGTAPGIAMTGTCDNCEFDHLAVTNLYVRTSQSRDNATAIGIRINYQDAGANQDNLLIHDNRFTHALQGVFVVYPAGSSSNYQFTNNQCSQVGSCVWYGSGDVNHSLDNVLVKGNQVSDLSPWAGCFDVGCPGDNWHHCDGLIHIFAAHPGSSITNLRIADNLATGPSCHTTELGGATTTAWIFVEGTGGGTIVAPQVYNNVIAQAGPTADGQIYIKGSTSAVVANNTIVSTHSATSIGCATSSMTVRNNVARQVGGVPIFDEGGCTGTSDYNNFHGYAWLAGPWTAGTHGRTQDPLLDAQLRLTASSPARDSGADVTSVCAQCVVDRTGLRRPQGSGWDMGAYELASVAPPTAPRAPTNLRVIVR